ncbi:MAG: SGNH/GDSL hydrolase family protein [Ignavibacteriales bacterium]|nr:SGNH/GDSL hydrolase family protein [Ignavibacteriales bacterium]
MKRYYAITGSLLAILMLLLSGCTDSAPDGPKASLGSVTVNKYVAIGNSLSAGYQSNGLYESAQKYSFPNLIAGQLTAAGAGIGKFEQPIYSDPGTPDPLTGKAARYEIISLTGPVIGPKGLTAGAPTNSALARPYDNMGIPGAVIYDFLDTTNVATKALPPPQRSNPLFQLVLRSQAAFGRSVYTQAKAQHPDLVTFWLGNNDVLGFATSGGTSPAAPTDAATFAFLYGQALDSLRAGLPNAKIVVANIPDVKAIPFFNTVGPKMAAAIPAAYYLRYQKHGVTGASYDSTKLTEAGAPLVCLTASPYASLLGQPTGAWYRYVAQIKSVPLSALMGSLAAVGIDTTKPFGFDPRNPFPDALVLDAGEQQTAAAATSAFNGTIAAKVAAKGCALADMNGFFTMIKTQGGIVANGETFTADYISGGLFSLDGVHPSSKGAGIVANKFIETMNASFGMSIPFVNITSLPGIPAPLAKVMAEKSIPMIPSSAFRSLEMLWGN